MVFGSVALDSFSVGEEEEKEPKRTKKVIITITTYIYLYHITVTHTVFGCQQQAASRLYTLDKAR